MEAGNSFVRNTVYSSHLKIGLPGVHSDIGGGYRPKVREQLWMTAPRRATVRGNEKIEIHPLWRRTEEDAQELRENGIAREGTISIKAWPAPRISTREAETGAQDYWITVVMDRQVRGELSLIALRVMRELGVRHGVPFDVISNTDKRFQLPEELQPISEQILEQALAGKEIRLAPADEALLKVRYIHQSAHWTPSGALMISKPAAMNRRYVYPDHPQRGYPQ
jgi:type VI secretion system secreted protein VgrG